MLSLVLFDFMVKYLDIYDIHLDMRLNLGLKTPILPTPTESIGKTFIDRINTILCGWGLELTK